MKLLSLFAISSTQGQLLSREACPEIPKIADFDAERYSGQWWVFYQKFYGHWFDDDFHNPKQQSRIFSKHRSIRNDPLSSNIHVIGGSPEKVMSTVKALLIRHG